MALAALTVRLLVPSRMEGGERGALAAVARFADEYPLAVTALLFCCFSLAAGHWSRRFGRRAPTVVPSSAPAVRGWRLGAFALGLALITILVRTNVVEAYRVVSPSMVPTLNVGDQLIVNHLAYGLPPPFSRTAFRSHPPKRGDIVVFRGSPSNPGSEPAPGAPRAQIKRVLGLPGDVIRFENGTPIVNGWPVPACDAGPFVSTAGSTTVRGRLAVEFLDDRTYLTIRTPLDDTRFGPFQVPAGALFVVGDDRSLSNDSRTWNDGRGGAVRVDDVLGRVSRLAVAAFRDGRLDLSSFFAPLRLDLREPNVDLRKTRERMAACLRARPSVTTPPGPPSN